MKSLAPIILAVFIVVLSASCSDYFMDDMGPAGILHDKAGLLSKKEQDDISSILEAHNSKGPGKIFIFIIEELPQSVTLEQFAREFNNSLMSLDGGKQNRILLLIAVKDRKLRIETSKDVWDLLTDDECRHIITNFIAPEFKKERYYSGISSGLSAMINELKE